MLQCFYSYMFLIENLCSLQDAVTPLSEAEAVDLVKTCFASATERDIYTASFFLFPPSLPLCDGIFVGVRLQLWWNQVLIRSTRAQFFAHEVHFFLFLTCPSMFLTGRQTWNCCPKQRWYSSWIHGTEEGLISLESCHTGQAEVGGAAISKFSVFLCCRGLTFSYESSLI